MPFSSTLKPPRPNSAGVVKLAKHSGSNRPSTAHAFSKSSIQTHVTLKQTSTGRVRISTTQVSSNAANDYDDEYEERERLREERRLKRTIRIATLYGMNSTAKLPTAKRKKKRPKTAPAKKKMLTKRRMQEAEEKERHKYTYLRHDSHRFVRGAQSFEMLTNVDGSPRDPKAAARAARDISISKRTWKMGYNNAISTRPVSGKKLEVDSQGRVKHKPKLGKGWPYDTSLNRPDLVRGPEPWQPPLTNKFPKDWPKTDYDAESPRGMHYPWSPPRRPSSAQEPLIGSPKNVYSKGRDKSLMASLRPSEYYQNQHDEQVELLRERFNTKLELKRQKSARSSRRMVRSATTNGRLSYPSTAGSSRRRPPTGSSTISTSRRVQFNAESPMRGKLRPRTAVLQERSPNVMRSDRPNTAEMTPSPARRIKMRPKSAMPKVRPQTASRNRGKKLGGIRSQSAKPSFAGDSPFRTKGPRRSAGRSRPSTGGFSRSNQRSPPQNKRQLNKKRSFSASLADLRKIKGKGAPHHLRPTTATKTKRKYRVGLWPSGRWKYEFGEHHTHHKKSQKGGKFKSSGSEEIHSDGDSDLSDAESVDENGETAKQRYARRNKDAKKRPMVAGQKKAKKMFESSSLATYTVMRSAPLKKQLLEEMLHAKEKEETKRVHLRNDACAWLLNHPRFKKMPMVRLWKKFSPIAIENIENKPKAGQSLAGTPKRKVPFGNSPQKSMRADSNGAGASESDQKPKSENKKIMQTVDEEPWRSEHLEFHNMWVSRPQFIYNMRVLMGLNETQKNLRELNKLFSSFDIKIEDMMNIREFCHVFVELREERKRAVFGGMPDVSSFYDAAKSTYKPVFKETFERRGSAMSDIGMM